MAKFTDTKKDGIDAFANKLEVPAGKRDVQVFDDEVPGFGIRKFASGVATYFVKFNVDTQQRRRSLGKVAKGTLDAARKEAALILLKARAGTDVVAVAKAEAAAQAAVVTLGDLVSSFLKDCEGKLREKTMKEYTRSPAAPPKTRTATSQS